MGHRKPRLTRARDAWRLTIPQYGFGKPTVLEFPTWEAGRDWLTSRADQGATGGSFEKSYVPISYEADMNVPPVIR